MDRKADLIQELSLLNGITVRHKEKNSKGTRDDDDSNLDLGLIEPPVRKRVLQGRRALGNRSTRASQTLVDESLDTIGAVPRNRTVMTGRTLLRGNRNDSATETRYVFQHMIFHLLVNT